MINKRKRNILITIIVLLSIASDQISKVWVRNNFESYIEKSIIGSKTRDFSYNESHMQSTL